MHSPTRNSCQVYIEDPEIKAMSDLRKSLEANDIRKFERTIRDKKNKIAEESFLMTYIEPLRRRMQEQVLLSITVPYKKITLLNLAIDLNLNVPEVNELLCALILDGKTWVGQVGSRLSGNHFSIS